jgi:hypothetical protein
VPMKNYIQYWFKKSIDKLTEEGQETIVGIVSIIVSEENEITTRSTIRVRDTIIVSPC